MTACERELASQLSGRAAHALLGLSRASTHRLKVLSHGPTPRPTPRAPASRLTPAERAVIVDTATSQEFVDKSVHQIYYTLLERGIYLASPRTMDRVLAAQSLVRERRQHTNHPPRAVPHLVATGPCQVTWDITSLQGPTRGPAGTTSTGT